MSRVHETNVPSAGPGSGGTAPEPETELRRLKRRLAEAWWNEEPLDVIEQLETSIGEHQGRGPARAEA